MSQAVYAKLVPKRNNKHGPYQKNFLLWTHTLSSLLIQFFIKCTYNFISLKFLMDILFDILKKLDDITQFELSFVVQDSLIQVRLYAM